jgi:uncharacterized protein YqjF (DUF2071 family)
LAILLGPALYGLPYPFGNADHYTDRAGTGHRRLHARTARFDCRFSWNSAGKFHRSAPGTLDEFPLERYSAFTWREGILRRFDIAHLPWLQTPAAVRIHCSRLIPGLDLWNPCQAHYSPGVDNIGIRMPIYAKFPYAIHVADRRIPQ